MNDLTIPNLKPIDELKALVQMGIPFEQAYAQCWQDLRLKENASKPRNNMINNHQQAKENGSKGGRPSKDKLSQPAKVVNNMLNRGMKVTEISDILGKSHQSVSQLVKKYGLPIQ